MKKLLKWAGFGFVGLVVLIGIVSVWAANRWNAPVSRAVVAMDAPADEATLERGKFLYTYSHTCWECHGDPLDASKPPIGGVKFDLNMVSPQLGVWYSRNITPDIETGIGGWTDGEIVRAIREGIRKDGTPLFPIMPMMPLHGLSDDDALALVAYLRTLPAVRNAVPANEASFFSKVMFTLGAIGPMEAIDKRIVAPERGPTALYGRYVANHGALCMDCHTPRSLKDGSFYMDSLFAGSSIGFGDSEGHPSVAYASNITPDMATGIGSWSEEAFLHFMRTGQGPDGTVRDGHMPYAATSRWADDDVKAVWAFLKTLRPIERSEVPRQFRGPALSDDPTVLGPAMYETYCARCHGPQGEGGLSADLALAEVAPTLKDAELEQYIRHGMEGTNMPGFERTLNDAQLRAVISHVRTLASPGAK